VSEERAPYKTDTAPSDTMLAVPAPLLPLMEYILETTQEILADVDGYGMIPAINIERHTIKYGNAPTKTLKIGRLIRRKKSA